MRFLDFDKNFSNIFKAALFERSSLNGMRASFILILSKHVSPEHLYETFFSYMCVPYFFSLIAGFLSNRSLNDFKIAKLGMIFSILGFAIAIVIPSHLSFILFFAGFGLFSPALSSIVGEYIQTTRCDNDTVYTQYYLSLNVGGILGPLSFGVLLSSLNPKGIFILGLCFSILTFIFLSKVKLKTSQMKNSKDNFLILIPLAILIGVIQYFHYLSYILLGFAFCMFMFLLYKIFIEKIIPWTLLIIIFSNILFWTLYEQLASSVVLFCENFLAFSVNIPFYKSFEASSSTLLFIPSLFVILFASFINRLWAKQKNDKQFFFLKASLGFFLVCLGFCVLILLSKTHLLHSISWQRIILVYFFFTIAELLIYPTSLSFINGYSPKNLRTSLMSFLYFSVGFSYVINHQFSEFFPLQLESSTANYESLFGFFSKTALCISSALLLLFLIVFRKTKNHTIGESL